jgi:hypothetical protein
VASAFLLPFAPWRPDARHPRIIEDLLEIARNHDPTVIAAMIDMLADLHASGNESRFVKKLRGYPLFELKTHARGHGKGGARIYFAFTNEGCALLLNAEVKTDAAPSVAKIREALAILLAYRDGEDVGLKGGSA